MGLKNSVSNAERKGVSPLAVYNDDLIKRRVKTSHTTDGRFHPSVASSYYKRKLLFPYLINPKTKKPYEPCVDKVTPEGERRLENGKFGHIRTQLGMVHAGLFLQRKPIPTKVVKYVRGLFEEYLREPADCMTELWEFALEYYCIEVVIDDKEDNAKGSCDGIIAHSGIYPFEFKTWNQSAYSRLITPELEHKLQATFYVRYLKRTYAGKEFYLPQGKICSDKFDPDFIKTVTLDDVDTACFWYEGKDKQTIKEFLLPISPDLERKLIKMLRSAAVLMKKGKMPKRIWNNPNAKPCTWCDFKPYCYGG